MKDILIIGSFVATRLYRPVQSFAMQYLDETQAHITLNIVFLLVVSAVIFHDMKSKKELDVSTAHGKNIHTYFMGLRRPTITDTMIALSIGLVLLGINTASILILQKSTTQIIISTSSFFWGITLIILASLTEELFYRSYVMAQLQRNMHSSPMVIILVISAFLFALGHIAYGVERTIFAFNAGIILSLLILLRKSLWGNTIAHCTYNLIIYSIAFFSFH